MVAIEMIDHIGIRIRDKGRSIAFYEALGFQLIFDAGFEKGHPIMLRHTSGVVLNLLGPSSEEKDENVLMDIEPKYAGYTHMALKVSSLPELEAFLEEKGIAVTGRFSFKDMSALFVRDPDRNVIEFDSYPGDDPASRMTGDDAAFEGYKNHGSVYKSYA